MNTRGSETPTQITPIDDRLAKGLGFLLDGEAVPRTDYEGPFGSSKSRVYIAQEDAILPNNLVVRGVELYADFTYKSTGLIKDCSAEMFDRNDKARIQIPLNKQTGEVDVQRLAMMSDETKQHVDEIAGRLAHVVFEV